VLLSTYYWIDKIKEMGRACGTQGEEEKYVQGFVGKSEGKKPLGRLRRL
jgi:hypothetical protein